jgi:hypothetical protein
VVSRASRRNVDGQQRLLYAAIDDIGESVRGNDAKAYAALVLHGLIFAGLTALVTQLGDVYEAATQAERVVGVTALGMTFATFVVSAWFLIDAVSPYRPVALDRKLAQQYRNVFFPTSEMLKACAPHDEMTRRLADMDEFTIRDELVAETLKLADILSHESNQTKWGYRILRAELVSAIAFVVTAAVSSL